MLTKKIVSSSLFLLIFLVSLVASLTTSIIPVSKVHAASSGGSYAVGGSFEFATVENRATMTVGGAIMSDDQFNNMNPTLKGAFGNNKQQLTDYINSLASNGGAVKFTDDGPWDGNEDYKVSLSHGDKTCDPSRIDGLNPGDTEAGTVSVKVPILNDTACMEFKASNVALRQAENLTLAFRWINGTKIETIVPAEDGIASTWEQKAGEDPNHFYSTDSNDKCPDYLRIESNETATMISVEQKSGGMGRSGDCAEGSWDGDHDWMKDIQMRITDVNNRSLAANAGTSNTDADGDGIPDAQETGGTNKTCESNNGTIIIGWLVCSFLSILDQTASKATEIVDNLLETDTVSLTQGGNEERLYKVWSLFRLLATVSLLIIGLIMIIGQAVSGE